MAKTILTPTQIQLLKLLSAQEEIRENFYLSGGTALAEYYLHHRYSEDLDFFSENEFNPIDIQTIIKKIQKRAGIIGIDFQQNFNRNLFFLHFKKETVKTEFTYYPFPQLEKSKIIQGLNIDSLLDIAVNKVFTIYQNPRSRDFIDLYLMLEMKNWTLEDLRKKAKIKFDTHIDPLQMTKQLLKAQEVIDFPRLIIDLKPKTWQDYWLKEAGKLKSEVLK